MEANFIEIESVEISKLEHHPQNPRKDLGDLTELRDSIWQNGILQNLTVVPSTDGSGKYWVIIGNRRLEAARGIKGLHYLPCVIREDMDEKDQMKTMLCENMQRADLTVYEQAQGFQLMLDLGASEDEIAKETGFSKKTVKQRLQMAQLDQEMLKKVSGRQIRLEDFDKVAKIEDKEAQTKLLNFIGTPDFEGAFVQTFKQQQINKNLPGIIKQLHKAGLTKIGNSERYGAKYRQMFGNDIDILKYDGKPLNIPPEATKYYDEYGRITLYRVEDKIVPQEKSEAEIERDKKLKERWAKVDELDYKYEEKRRIFIEDLLVLPHQKMDILSGLMAAMVFNGRETWLRRALFRFSGIYDAEKSIWEYGQEGIVAGVNYLKVAVITGKLNALKAIAFEAFGCHDIIVGEGKENPDEYKGVKCHSTQRYWSPEFDEHVELTALYDWLKSLGYEMDDEEVSYYNGTHPVFLEEEGA